MWAESGAPVIPKVFRVFWHLAALPTVAGSNTFRTSLCPCIGGGGGGLRRPLPNTSPDSRLSRDRRVSTSAVSRVAAASWGTDTTDAVDLNKS